MTDTIQAGARPIPPGPAPRDAFGGRAGLVPWHAWRSQAEFAEGLFWLGRDASWRVERAVAEQERARGALIGYCVACARQVDFTFPPGEPGTVPHWRENLVCTGCGLYQRHRLALALLATLARDAAPRVFLTEHASKLYAWLDARVPDVVGSEFVADPERERVLSQYIAHLTEGRRTRVRHEDATALTLATASRDAIVTLDVLEHVPDYRRALAEFARVLAPGGVLIVTVPFVPTNAETVVRARLRADGSIEHLLEPEWHGDPTTDAGCLCFHNFGWDLIDALRAAGFRDAALVDAWAPTLGFMGFNGLLVAQR